MLINIQEKIAISHFFFLTPDSLPVSTIDISLLIYSSVVASIFCEAICFSIILRDLCQYERLFYSILQAEGIGSSGIIT